VALKDLFKSRDVPQTDPRARLNRAVSDAEGLYLAAQDAYNEAVDSMAEGYGGEAPVERTEQALLQAKQALDRAKMMLASYDAGQASKARKARIGDLDTQWLKAIDLAEERGSLAEQVAKDIARLQTDLKNLLAKTQALATALPNTPDPSGALLQESAILGRLATELVRAGTRGDREARAVHDAPAFLSSFAGIPDLIRTWREAHMKETARV